LFFRKTAYLFDLPRPLPERGSLLARKPNFVGTDHTGRWLLSASYAAGKVVMHKLGEPAKAPGNWPSTASTPTRAN
jgi:hypothetical protein